MFGNEIEYNINSSYIDSTSKAGKNCYIEYSIVKENSTIGENSIISNSILKNVDIPSNVCISTVKLKNNKYVSRIYGINDNPKDLWEDKLFIPTDTKEDSVKQALKLYNSIYSKTFSKEEKDDFSNEKISIKESNEMEKGTFKERRKLYKESNLENCEIKNMICPEEYQKLNIGKIEKDFVEIKLPIRVNFGGGWTDTIPYCIDRGGRVINAAFTLNGELPIRCEIHRIKENAIILKSKDLDRTKKITKIEELKNFNNKDIFTLLKTALIVAGIVREEDNSVFDIIKRIQGGICIQTDATQIPMGSGLGTSSILASACLIAINEFFGIKISKEDICYQVLQLEQLMGTCGGWQDQIGGVIEGIKYTTTEAGQTQKFDIEKIEISNETRKEFNERFILIYTGECKRAEKLLKTIMNRYMMEDSDIIQTLQNIKDMAYNMKESLVNNDFDKFCNQLNEHWELSKQLDESCTNETIEKILETSKDFIDAKMICGAGGRGFLQIVLKKGIQKEKLQNKLDEKFQNSNIKIYSVELYEGEK